MTDTDQQDENQGPPGSPPRVVQGTGDPRLIATHVDEARRRHNYGVAYNAIEEREFAIRQRQIVEFDVMVSCWMQAINVMDSGVSARQPRPVLPEHQQAHRTQKLLFNLGIGTVKSGLDAIIAGYMPAGFAAIRLLTEIIIAIRYLHAFPEKAELWWRMELDPSGQRYPSPGVKSMRDKIVAARGKRSDERFTMIDRNIEQLYDSFWDHSIGDHATPELLRGMMQADGSVETYPTYNLPITLYLFHSGCLAIATLLGMLPVMLQFTNDDPLDEDALPDRPGFWPLFASTIDELIFHRTQLFDKMLLVAAQVERESKGGPGTVIEPGDDE